MNEQYEEVWGNIDMRQALRDIISRNNTGYKYDEIVAQIRGDNPDELEEEEIDSIDKTVNLLAHMFKYYASKEKQ